MWKILGLGLSLWTTLLHGQQPLSLKAAIQLAYDSHPALAASTQRVVGAGGLVVQARQRPNPMVTAQSENWNARTPSNAGPTSSDQFLYAQQTLETAGKRQRRIELSQSEERLSQLERELLVRQIGAKVALAYWAAAGAERAAKLLEDALQNYTLVVEYHENRVREGAIAEADLIRVRLEEDRARAAALSAGLEAQRARVQLFREMGLDEFPLISLDDNLDGSVSLPPLDVESAFKQRVEVQVALQSIERARADSRLQRSLARPDLIVLAGYKRNAGYNTGMFGFQFAIPLGNRNQGNIAAALSEIKATEADLAAARSQVRADLQAARQSVNSRREQIAALEAGSLRRAQESVEIARAVYREGGADLLRLLDAERIGLEVRILHVKAQMEYQQSAVEFQFAMGMNP